MNNKLFQRKNNIKTKHNSSHYYNYLNSINIDRVFEHFKTANIIDMRIVVFMRSVCMYISIDVCMYFCTVESGLFVTVFISLELKILLPN